MYQDDNYISFGVLLSSQLVWAYLNRKNHRKGAKTGKHCYMLGSISRSTLRIEVNCCAAQGIRIVNVSENIYKVPIFSNIQNPLHGPLLSLQTYP